MDFYHNVRPPPEVQPCQDINVIQICRKRYVRDFCNGSGPFAFPSFILFSHILDISNISSRMNDFCMKIPRESSVINLLCSLAI